MSPRPTMNPWLAKDLAVALRLEREAFPMTIAELAQDIGVTRQTLARWESHKSVPALDVFIIWARALGYTVSLR